LQNKIYPRKFSYKNSKLLSITNKFWETKTLALLIQMKRSEVIEAYYFTKEKSTEISALISDFPSCFSAPKLTPLNFQLHMTEMAEEIRSKSDKSGGTGTREKLSVQSTMTKFDLRKTLLSDILQFKDKYSLFHTLASQEEKSERLWLYIDKDTKLRGPFTCKEMQAKFEKDELEPSTKIKKKLEENWSQMNVLLNHFVKLNLVKKFESGHSVQEVMRMSMSNCSFDKGTSNTGKLESKRPATLGVENWITGIHSGQKGGIRPYAASFNDSGKKPELKAGRSGDGTEMVSMVFNKPRVFDKNRKSGNQGGPVNPLEGTLFAKIQDEFNTPQKSHTGARKSFTNTGDGGGRGGGGDNRSRQSGEGGGRGGGNRQRVGGTGRGGRTRGRGDYDRD
jgi:hypothetical protein